MKNPFTRPADKPANQNPLAAVIDDLTELAAITARYHDRRSEFDAAATQPPTSFALSPAECAAYGETANALAYAKSIEAPLLASVRSALSEADRARNQAEDRIRARHARIDSALCDAVRASMPAELDGLVITREANLAIRGSLMTQAIGGGVVENKISIWSTAPGRAEAAARLSTNGIHIDGLSPTASIDDARRVLTSAVVVIERLATEETRCVGVLAKYPAANKAA